MRCINCGISVQRLRRHLISSLSVHLQERLSHWLLNQLRLDAFICHPCFSLLDTDAAKNERVRGHNLVCFGCGKSVRQLRYYDVNLDSPVGAVLLSQILDYQPSGSSHVVCRDCWRRADRVAVHDPSIDTIGELSLNDTTPINVSTVLDIKPPVSPPIAQDQEDDENSDEAPDPEPGRSVRCNLCREDIAGFVFACVQCNVLVCQACDDLGQHAAHYVLRAPAGRPVSEVELILNKVREQLSGAEYQLTTPDADQETKENEGEPAVILEIKTEDIEDPLGNVDCRVAVESQVVPELTEIKSEPPDTTPITQETASPVTSPSSRRRHSSDSEGDGSQPPRKKRNDSGNQRHSVVTYPSHAPLKTNRVFTLKTAKKPSSSLSANPRPAVDYHVVLDPGIPGSSSGATFMTRTQKEKAREN